MVSPVRCARAQTPKLPLIPLEKEIDELIACVGRKMAVILQALKETEARIGEALKIEWNDVDTEKRMIAINHPEKHGNTRVAKVSDKLIAMLNRLPRDRGTILGT